METRLCPNCKQDVPFSHKFCGFCGTTLHQEDSAAPAAAPKKKVGRAKLVLIRGEGLDGISYQLNAQEHIAGRVEGVILFPDDRLISPQHANFVYKEDGLYVQDLDSHNGIYMRVKDTEEILPNDFFICGEQLLQVQPPLSVKLVVESEGTYFYGSPPAQWYFRLVQILRGGLEGLVFSSKKQVATIGREDCDLNFAQDRFISRYHTKIEARDDKFYVSDLDSRNGSYMRVHGERRLQDGDYVFLGRQLLRVEMPA